MSKISPQFMSTHCEPLSPATQNGPNSKDQLESIISVLGNLDKSDLSFVTDQDTADALENINLTQNKSNFKESFPNSDDGLISMLQSMLEFNPFFRKKPEEYLQADLFEPWRKMFPELLVAPSKLIKLEIDQKGAFDYDQS